MKIFYIPLGSFCYPKIIIRETNREYAESLPFDFNSSPHMSGITNIMKELYETGTYDLELKEILEIYNENELSVKEKNMYLVHFFKTYDLKENSKHFPAPATLIQDEVVEEVRNKFKKRFDRLYNLMNDPYNLLCFVRIENYDNYGWKNELIEFTKILSMFKNPNKFLIYSQNMIDEKLHFDNSRKLNYDFYIPILFCKHYFYDMEVINNKDLFLQLFTTFEYVVHNDHIIHIEKDGIPEKYYIDMENSMLFKLTNINYFSKYYFDYNRLYINNAINGFDVYIKNEQNIFVKDLSNEDHSFLKVN